MFTTSTTVFLVMFVLYGALSTLILAKTGCYANTPNRFARIAALLLPLVSMGIEAFYHSMTEMGFEIPRVIHDLASPLLFAGLYYMTKSHNTDDNDEDDDVEDEDDKEVEAEEVITNDRQS